MKQCLPQLLHGGEDRAVQRLQRLQRLQLVGPAHGMITTCLSSHSTNSTIHWRKSRDRCRPVPALVELHGLPISLAADTECGFMLSQLTECSGRSMCRGHAYEPLRRCRFSCHGRVSAPGAISTASGGSWRCGSRPWVRGWNVAGVDSPFATFLIVHPSHRNRGGLRRIVA